MNLFVGIGLFSLIVICGYKLSNKYKNKEMFYKSMLSFNRRLTSNVAFRRDELFTIYSLEYDCKEFSNMLIHFKQNNNDDTNFLYPEYLSDEEVLDIKTYFAGIGMNDVQTQLNILNDYSNIFQSKYETCRMESNRRGQLYRKLSFMVGLIAFIIVI